MRVRTPMLGDIDVDVQEHAALPHLLKDVQNEAWPRGTKANGRVAQIGWHATATRASDLLAQIPRQRCAARTVAEDHRVTDLAKGIGDEAIAKRRQNGSEPVRLR